MRKYIPGTIEPGFPLLKLALLGGMTVSNYRADASVWHRALRVVIISLATIAGFALPGRPDGMASTGKDDRINPELLYLAPTGPDFTRTFSKSKCLESSRRCCAGILHVIAVTK